MSTLSKQTIESITAIIMASIETAVSPLTSKIDSLDKLIRGSNGTPGITNQVTHIMDSLKAHDDKFSALQSQIDRRFKEVDDDFSKQNTMLECLKTQVANAGEAKDIAVLTTRVLELEGKQKNTDTFIAEGKERKKTFIEKYVWPILVYITGMIIASAVTYFSTH